MLSSDVSMNRISALSSPEKLGSWSVSRRTIAENSGQKGSILPRAKPGVASSGNLDVDVRRL